MLLFFILTDGFPSCSGYRTRIMGNRFLNSSSAEDLQQLYTATGLNIGELNLKYSTDRPGSVVSPTHELPQTGNSRRFISFNQNHNSEHAPSYDGSDSGAVNTCFDRKCRGLHACVHRACGWTRLTPIPWSGPTAQSARALKQRFPRSAHTQERERDRDMKQLRQQQQWEGRVAVEYRAHTAQVT